MSPSAVTVRGLIGERDRLLQIGEEWKAAQPKIKALNSIIALYGETEQDDFDELFEFPCPKCDKIATSKGGLGVHLTRMHPSVKRKAPVR